jgi:hypothetical protein
MGGASGKSGSVALGSQAEGAGSRICERLKQWTSLSELNRHASLGNPVKY